MAEIKKPFHETVAEKLIEQLKRGTAPWQKPWQAGVPGAFMPANPTTGKRYRGINAIHLMSQGHSDQRWMTYKQATAVGAQVRKGEKGTPIQYWKFNEEQTKTGADGKPVLDARGEAVKLTIALERPRVFLATVFNAGQIDGLPPIEARKEQEWHAMERAEQILQASNAVIRHGEQNRAFYRPATDSIHLPDKDRFPSADKYYATALHELGHWTGHGSRLDRDLAHPFGSEGYAREELRAEIASMILGSELGIGHDPAQHAAYVGSWIKALQDDPLEIFRAAADAEKIQDYVLGLEQRPLQEQATRQNQEQDQINAAALAAVLAVDSLNARIEAATELVDLRQAESRVAATRLDLPANSEEFDRLTQEALGFTLPHNWNGHVQVQGHVAVNLDGQQRVNSAATSGVEPQFRGVYAQCENGMHEWLADYPTQQQAEKLAERLGLIDAHSETNEHEKALKLARVHEERVRRDPGSTMEDMSAAREARKDAEFAATQNAIDLQRRVANDERERQTPAPAAAPQTGQTKPEPDKNFINVPFSQKDEARALGAKWDRQEQSWYVSAGVDPTAFAKWAQGTTAKAAAAPLQPQTSHDKTKPGKPVRERQYLAVPYGERVAAMASGAAWDKGARSWYAGPKADMAKLERWKADRVPGQQGPAMTPKEEFGEALRFLGCVVKGDHPVMDGQKHRISVEGEKHSEKAGSGFYVGHLNGHPAGYIKNNKTGIDMKWKSKGYALDPAQKAQMQAEAAAKRQEREAGQGRLHEQAAQRVGKQMADLVPALQPTAYMRTKGIEPQPGVLTDKEGRTTYVPATDVEGKQWSMQYIQEDGTKRFAKDSRKEGCFHVVGGIDALARAPALVIAEGYATASSLSQSLGFATIAAFDSGNLPRVAMALHERFPDKPVIIAGDDDRHLEATQGVNPGKTKAEEAAKATGGRVLLPIFAPGEQVASPKGFTDFNDLATKSVLGKGGIDRQVRSVVGSVIAKHQTSITQQARAQQEQCSHRAAKIG
jgi:putative DNA primase/helicase